VRRSARRTAAAACHIRGPLGSVHRPLPARLAAEILGAPRARCASQNWVAAAGLTGGRVNRFNIVKQSKDYDADGAYVRHWLPELKNLPTQYVHEPWKMSRAEQEQYGCKIGSYGAPDVDYPNPPKSRFSYGGDGGGKGGGKGGGGRGGGGGRNVPSTPAQAAAMANRGGGKGRGRSGGRGGGRKRVQHGSFAMDDE
jgi:hypothetical protein